MNEIVKLVIFVVLLLQGLSHGTAAYALFKDAARAEGQPPVPVRSWLLPSLAPKTAAWIASIFWLLATLGFVATALTFWQVMMPVAAWQALVAASAIVSMLGIGLFSGIWPGAPTRKLARIDTVIALLIDVVVLVLLVVGWLPGALYGS